MQGTPVPVEVVRDHPDAASDKFKTSAVQYTSAALGHLRVDPVDSGDLHCNTDRTEGECDSCEGWKADRQSADPSLRLSALLFPVQS